MDNKYSLHALCKSCKQEIGKPAHAEKCQKFKDKIENDMIGWWMGLKEKMGNNLLKLREKIKKEENDSRIQQWKRKKKNRENKKLRKIEKGLEDRR